MLKLKKDHKSICVSSDFWYDLSSGGYIDPKDFLTPEDAAKVAEAVNTILQFETLLETSDILEYS